MPIFFAKSKSKFVRKGYIFTMSEEVKKFKEGLTFSFGFVGVLWAVKLMEMTLAMDFGALGILPRTLQGSIGVVFGPLVHGDITHLLSNTFPLLLLLICIFYFYNRIAIEVFVWIYIVTGIWVWVSARDAYHIGASGVIYGLVAFLFFSGLFRKESRAMAVSLVVMFLYGGMVYGVLPTSQGISWESHLLGSLAGVFIAFFFRKKDMYGKPSTDIQQDEPARLPFVQGNDHFVYAEPTKKVEDNQPVHYHYTFVSRLKEEPERKKEQPLPKEKFFYPFPMSSTKDQQ
jgi:membrane associated rhomboid family serine protease